MFLLVLNTRAFLPVPGNWPLSACLNVSKLVFLWLAQKVKCQRSPKFKNRFEIDVNSFLIKPMQVLFH